MIEENSLGWFVKHQVEPLLVGVKYNKTINAEDVMCPKACKGTEIVYNSWKDKAMHDQCLRDLDEENGVQAWKWLKESDLKG